MSDEPTNNNVEEVVADPSQPIETPEEPIVTPEAEEPAEEPAPEEPAEEPAQEEDPKEVPEEKPPSRREQLRIQQLLQRYGLPPERQASQPPLQPKDRLDYGQALDADPEIIKQLEDDRRRSNEAQYNAGLEQAKTIQFHTRLEIDAPQVESKYSFLNPTDKENFDPVRADAMNQLYIMHTGYSAGDPSKGIPETVQNPNIRYRDFVESQMEFAEALMADRQTQTVKNVAKQSAQTGLRPDGSSAKRLNLNQAPENMTVEELYAKLGQTPPKK